ncbi:hypothetical protein ADL05_06145 [Nocardiopsis sp. NRRL B-16309]|nr:hypothetical protein ADL05_06145 [Nocardiopsis sp. NRRL B-16309]
MLGSVFCLRLPFGLRLGETEQGSAQLAHVWRIAALTTYDESLLMLLAPLIRVFLSFRHRVTPSSTSASV